MRKYDLILEALNTMTDDRIIAIHNEYCCNAGYMDDYIYNMEEFDEIMDGMKPWEIARAAYYSGKFCPAHDWFWFNGYGNLESSDFPAHDAIYKEDIAGYIYRTDDALDDDDIQEILDDYENL